MGIRKLLYGDSEPISLGLNEASKEQPSLAKTDPANEASENKDQADSNEKLAVLEKWQQDFVSDISSLQTSLNEALAPLQKALSTRDVPNISQLLAQDNALLKASWQVLPNLWKKYDTLIDTAKTYENAETLREKLSPIMHDLRGKAAFWGSIVSLNGTMPSGERRFLSESTEKVLDKASDALYCIISMIRSTELALNQLKAGGMMERSKLLIHDAAQNIEQIKTSNISNDECSRNYSYIP